MSSKPLGHKGSFRSMHIFTSVSGGKPYDDEEITKDYHIMHENSIYSSVMDHDSATCKDNSPEADMICNLRDSIRRIFRER
jgi:hypothetical protein